MYKRVLALLSLVASLFIFAGWTEQDNRGNLVNADYLNWKSSSVDTLANTIVARDSGGRISSAYPDTSWNVATREYVDAAVASAGGGAGGWNFGAAVSCQGDGTAGYNCATWDLDNYDNPGELLMLAIGDDTAISVSNESYWINKRGYNLYSFSGTAPSWNSNWIQSEGYYDDGAGNSALIPTAHYLGVNAGGYDGIIIGRFTISSGAGQFSSGGNIQAQFWYDGSTNTLRAVMHVSSDYGAFAWWYR